MFLSKSRAVANLLGSITQDVPHHHSYFPVNHNLSTTSARHLKQSIFATCIWMDHGFTWASPAGHHSNINDRCSRQLLLGVTCVRNDKKDDFEMLLTDYEGWAWNVMMQTAAFMRNNGNQSSVTDSSDALADAQNVGVSYRWQHHIIKKKKKE